MSRNEGRPGSCTKCDGTFERYIISRKGLWWDIGSGSFRQFRAGNATVPRIHSLENVPAWRCTKCRLIMFNYRNSCEFLKKCVKCRAEISLAAGKCQACGARQQGRFS